MRNRDIFPTNADGRTVTPFLSNWLAAAANGSAIAIAIGSQLFEIERDGDGWTMSKMSRSGRVHHTEGHPGPEEALLAVLQDVARQQGRVCVLSRDPQPTKPDKSNYENPGRSS